MSGARFFSIALVTALVAPLSASADDRDFEIAFDRPFGVSAYAVGWGGTYAAYGAGGRVRYEPWSQLGLEIFGEVLEAEWPGSSRTRGTGGPRTTSST